MTDLSVTDKSGVRHEAGADLLPGSLVMFFLSFCGMAVGLAIDLRSVVSETIASLCLGPHSFVDGVLAHAALLPATNILTLLSGFVAIGIKATPARTPGDGQSMRSRLPFYAVCNAAMLAGMLAAAAFGPRLAAWLGLPWSAEAMLAAMALGMAGGMAATAAVSRTVRTR